MAVQIVRTAPVSAARLWSVVVDWPRHAEHVPLTRMRVDGPPGVGQVLDATTGVGRLVFHDTMRVDQWQPPADGRPGAVTLTKTGRVLHGSARIEVATTSSGSQMTWVEHVRPAPRWLGRAVGPIADRASDVVFGRAVDGLVRDAVEGR